jgi:hypothetical protein
MVKQMAENFEWIMLESTEQALANHASSGLTLPPEVLSKQETEVLREVSKLKDSPCSELQTVLRAGLVASPLHRPRRRHPQMNAGSHVEMGRAEEDPETAEAPTSQHDAGEVELTEMMSTASSERTHTTIWWKAAVVLRPHLITASDWSSDAAKLWWAGTEDAPRAADKLKGFAESCSSKSRLLY